MFILLTKMEIILNKILLKKFSTYNSNNLVKINESTNNDVYSFDDYIIKISIKQNLKLEYDILSKLIWLWNFPKPILYQENIEWHNILILEKLDWILLDKVRASFDEWDKQRLVSQILLNIKVIHSLKLQQFGESFIQEFETNFNRAIQNPFIDKNEIIWLHEYVLNNVYQFDSLLVGLIHNDIWYKNILVNNWKLSWIIDFEMAKFRPLCFEYFRLLHHRLSAQNYIDSGALDYTEVNFLDHLIAVFEKDYSQITISEDSLSYNLFCIDYYFRLLLNYEKEWYNHAAVNKYYIHNIIMIKT